MSAFLAPSWAPVHHDGGAGVSERRAIGTDVRVVVADPARLACAQAAVDAVLDRLDRVASRFRPDSELSRLNALGAGGGTFLLSPDLRGHLAAALAAARWSRGLVDPTIGAALLAAGYDDDLDALPEDDPRPAVAAPVPGPRSARLAGSLLELEAGVVLDLGATAKALAADQAAQLVAEACACPALVSFGGDLAVAPGGAVAWPVLVEEAPAAVPRVEAQLVTVRHGGLATSSTTRRRWRRGGIEQHHLIDPRTGAPCRGPFRTVTVAAPTCLEANVASTAALVAGAAGIELLDRSGLPGRLVGHDGHARLLGGWPAGDGAALPRAGEPLLSRCSDEARTWWA